MENYFTIGKIVNTQGVKGEVRVIPTTDDPQRYKLLKDVFLLNPINGNIESAEIQTVRFHKQFVIVGFKGISDMTAAEKLKGFVIKIPESLALPLSEDEFYIRDLYGIDVFTDNGERLGIVSDIIFTAANDVYVVKGDDNKELLLPAIKSCILNVDIEQNKMTVHLLEGLR